jgi:hypothetical protein
VRDIKGTERFFFFVFLLRLHSGGFSFGRNRFSNENFSFLPLIAAGIQTERRLYASGMAVVNKRCADLIANDASNS